MRIVKSLMLGVAGSVLFAGGAMAADPMPIVVPTMPAVAAPVPGRQVMVDIEAGIDIGLNETGLYVSAGFNGLIDVRSASGWGIRFDGGAGMQLVPGFGGEAVGYLTLYRAIGDLELGVFAGAAAGGPPFDIDVGVGLAANYLRDTGRLYIRSDNKLLLWPSINLSSYTEAAFKLRDNITLSAFLDVLFGFNAGIGVDVNLTDRLEVWGNLYANTGGLNGARVGAEFALTDRFSVWGNVGFDLGGIFDTELGTTFALSEVLSIKSELDLDFGPVEINYFNTWAELDRPIGTGPLSLTAALGVGFDPDDGGAYAWGNVGITYKLGVPDHSDNRLFGDDADF